MHYTLWLPSTFPYQWLYGLEGGFLVLQYMLYWLFITCLCCEKRQYSWLRICEEQAHRSRKLSGLISRQQLTSSLLRSNALIEEILPSDSLSLSLFLINLKQTFLQKSKGCVLFSFFLSRSDLLLFSCEIMKPSGRTTEIKAGQKMSIDACIYRLADFTTSTPHQLPCFPCCISQLLKCVVMANTVWAMHQHR